MNAKTKKIVSVVLFLIIFSLLVIIATIYDYKISEILASKGLENGNYFSNNIFGRIFEVIGEMPLYLFLMFAMSILVVNCDKISKQNIKIISKIILYVGGILICFYGIYKIGKYLSELNTSLYFLHDNYLTYAVMLLLSIIIQLLLCFLMQKHLKDLCIKLLPFAFVIIVTAALSQIIVQGIKPFFARERFRAIYYLEYRNVTSQGFTKWFVMNGSASKIANTFASDLNVTSTFFSSFPSGHTAGAGITYSLIALPLCIQTFNNKKYKWLFYVIPIVITGTVALSRIVMGAHYMSDVLFGGTLAFLSTVIGILIFNKIKIKCSK